MNGYLFDTCVVSALLDPRRPNYQAVRTSYEQLPTSGGHWVSRITIAELMFGVAVHHEAHGTPHPRASEILRRAQEYPIREVTRHTAEEYAKLRTRIATTYLASTLRSNRAKYIDSWRDRLTQETLQIDENDVWICAQAIEQNLTLVTTDANMEARISRAEPALKFLLLPAV